MAKTIAQSFTSNVRGLAHHLWTGGIAYGKQTIKENTSNRSKHFGVVNLSIHYSLAAGLAEQLGDQVERAVMSAIRKIGADNGKFSFDGAMIRMDPFWHRRQDPSEAVLSGRPENAVSIHLSNDLEGEMTFSVDWEWF